MYSYVTIVYHQFPYNNQHSYRVWSLSLDNFENISLINYLSLVSIVASPLISFGLRDSLATDEVVTTYTNSLLKQLISVEACMSALYTNIFRSISSHQLTKMKTIPHQTTIRDP